MGSRQRLLSTSPLWNPRWRSTSHGQLEAGIPLRLSPRLSPVGYVRPEHAYSMLQGKSMLRGRLASCRIGGGFDPQLGIQRREDERC